MVNLRGWVRVTVLQSSALCRWSFGGGAQQEILLRGMCVNLWMMFFKSIVGGEKRTMNGSSLLLPQIEAKGHS